MKTNFSKHSFLAINNIQCTHVLCVLLFCQWRASCLSQEYTRIFGPWCEIWYFCTGHLIFIYRFIYRQKLALLHFELIVYPMILDPMILDPVIFDLVILDSVIFDLVILDSVILDSVILDPAFPWSQIPPPAVYLITAVLIVLVVLCCSSNKRGPEQAQP